MNLLQISRLLVASLSATASTPGERALTETGITVTLPHGFTGDARGRLLLFAAPATNENAGNDMVDADASNKEGVSIVGRDIAGFGPRRSVTIDAQWTAISTGLPAFAAGDYRLQAVLDRNGDYAYAGRGPGDLISRVMTVHFPLAPGSAIKLDHVLPPDTGQFDVTGIPPVAAAQIAASRPNLHEERIASDALTRFRGTRQDIAAWVLTPPGYNPKARVRYPTVYTANGFGTNHKLDGQLLSQIWHLMETHAIPPMIWVALDYGTPMGTTEFADSVNNGPWGHALVSEVIPALESKYSMDAKPSGRFLTGHSSGGWFALWAMVRYPTIFGGSWPISPDPSDFHDFLGVDLYAPGANMYRDANGVPRPIERDHDKVMTTMEAYAKAEASLGDNGGQLRSFEWVFSPRRADGKPALMFDRESGAIDPAVVAYWRENFDIGYRIATDWPRLKHDLDGKVHLTVGAVDSYYLDGSAHRLESAFQKVGGHADFTFVPIAGHGVAEVYSRGSDRLALWKDIANAMYAMARPCTGSKRR